LEQQAFMSASSSRVLQRTELKTTGYLATIFALRMFGLCS